MDTPDQTCSSSTIGRCCAVCGDSPAKVHYGVLACFGCKGFFRRAVKDGRNKYICRYEKQCAVNKYERNSCRYCRFRKCLQVGMNPDAVRPDREETRSRKPVLTKKKSLPKPNSIRADEDEWTRLLSPEQRIVLLDLIKLEAFVQNANEHNYDSVKDFTLKSLVADRMLTDKNSHSNQSGVSSDISFTAFWRVISVVDWIEGVVKCTEGAKRNVTVEDKTALVQDTYMALTLLSLSMRAALSSSGDPTNLYLSSSPCSRAFATDIVRRLQSEIIGPLRKLEPSDAEFVLLKAILALNPDATGICNAASNAIREQREVLQSLLFRVIKKSRSKMSMDVGCHFGSLLLLASPLKLLATEISMHLRSQFSRDNCSAPFQRTFCDVFNPVYDDLLLHRECSESEHLEHPIISSQILHADKKDESPILNTAQFSRPMPPPFYSSNFIAPPAPNCFPPCFYSPPPPPFYRPAFSLCDTTPMDRPSSLSIPKIPLTLTKSIEEMLRPGGATVEELNKPLPADWADTVGYSTPIFNREVVSQFFPEINANSDVI